MGNGQELRDLLEERGELYGDSWKLGGRLVAVFANWVANRWPGNSQYWHPVVMILVKVARLSASPEHIDTWRDIAGYAMMVVEHLEREAKDAPF